MLEQVFVLEDGDVGELYRIRSFLDTDGIFYASLDRFDQELEAWEESYLTQFQQDAADVVPILDEDQEILVWFGFTLDDVASQAQLDEIAKGVN